MPKNGLRKVNWTLAFDSALKDLVVKAARQKGMQPVTLLEDLVRKEFNSFGCEEQRRLRHRSQEEEPQAVGRGFLNRNRSMAKVSLLVDTVY